MSLSARSPAWLSSAWGYMERQVACCRHGKKANEDEATIALSPNGYDFSNGEFPRDVIRHIFQKVDSAADLGRLAQVCKRFQTFANQDFVWNTLSFKQLFPPLSKGVTHIDGAVWKECGVLDEHGLDISGELAVRPCLDKATYLRIRKLITLPTPAKSSLLNWLFSSQTPATRIEGEKGITILTMPEGLTLRKLKAIFDAKHPGANDPKLEIWDSIMEKYGDLRVDRTYTVILTDNRFTGSRSKSIKEQLDLLEVVGCKIPKALQVVALIVMRYLSSPEQRKVRLYGNNPMTYTRNEEVIMEHGKERRVVVGGFGPRGPGVGSDGGFLLDGSSDGVGGAWEFPAIGP